MNAGSVNQDRATPAGVSRGRSGLSNQSALLLVAIVAVLHLELCIIMSALFTGISEPFPDIPAYFREYLIGIPLCWCSTAFHAVGAYFGFLGLARLFRVSFSDNREQLLQRVLATTVGLLPFVAVWATAELFSSTTDPNFQYACYGDEVGKPKWLYSWWLEMLASGRFLLAGVALAFCVTGWWFRRRG